jgi:hypothetical protein
MPHHSTRRYPMKLHGSGNRRGFALVVALAALVIIGGLIVGAFFASTQEFRIGRNTVLQSRAMTSAEYGLNVALSDGIWDEEWNNSLDVGKVLTGATPLAFTPGDGSAANVTVTNLGNGNYFVVSEGFAGASLGAQGRKRVGGLVTLRKPKINILGAVTSKLTIMVNGTSEIRGEDTTPAEWSTSECPPLDGPKPGIVIGPGGDLTKVQCDGCVTGDPPVTQSDSAGYNSTYTDFGGMTYDELAAMANLTFPDNTTITSIGPVWDVDKDGNVYCKTGNVAPLNLNWGDPEHLDVRTQCRSYFPIIHVTGDLQLSGGVGQGILLVDGDLGAQGGVAFFGPIIVRGKLSVTGGGSAPRFVGGVMAANSIDLSDSKIAGGALVSYSSCAISKAVNGSARPMFNAQRGWVEMY